MGKLKNILSILIFSLLYSCVPSNIIGTYDYKFRDESMTITLKKDSIFFANFSSKPLIDITSRTQFVGKWKKDKNNVILEPKYVPVKAHYYVARSRSDFSELRIREECFYYKEYLFGKSEGEIKRDNPVLYAFDSGLKLIGILESESISYDEETKNLESIYHITNNYKFFVYSDKMYSNEEDILNNGIAFVENKFYGTKNYYDILIKKSNCVENFNIGQYRGYFWNYPKEFNIIKKGILVSKDKKKTTTLYKRNMGESYKTKVSE